MGQYSESCDELVSAGKPRDRSLSPVASHLLVELQRPGRPAVRTVGCRRLLDPQPVQVGLDLGLTAVSLRRADRADLRRIGSITRDSVLTALARGGCIVVDNARAAPPG